MCSDFSSGQAAEPAVATGWTAYLAADGFLNELCEELGATVAIHDRLVIAEGPPRPAAWAENIWHDPVRITIHSIADGAKALRGIQRNWALYSTRLHRRASLIQDRLPSVSAKPLVFPQAPPTAPLGSWTLLDETTILAAAHCSSPFPNGAVAFIEDKAMPPNRAYLKLWEALIRIGRMPGPGDLCLDLGASPGGWSWVLQTLGARVIAVDKAPLAPRIARLANIESRQDSAFALAPRDVGAVDWLFSDVICYPERLYRLVTSWIDSGLARNMVCTVKFQGATDFAMQRRFAELPGSQLMHLHHNKHELTWVRLAANAG
jgi:23S rRNA (cytidine2498-2'-O)-methyltransferase